MNFARRPNLDKLVPKTLSPVRSAKTRALSTCSEVIHHHALSPSPQSLVVLFTIHKELLTYQHSNAWVVRIMSLTTLIIRYAPQEQQLIVMESCHTH